MIYEKARGLLLYLCLSMDLYQLSAAIQKPILLEIIIENKIVIYSKSSINRYSLAISILHDHHHNFAANVMSIFVQTI